MFSLATAGILRVGVLVLAGGAIAGGFYLYAETRGDDAEPQLQATPAATESPADVATPETTATAPLTPSRTPMDTSDWETYASPHGFSISVPPEWKIVVFPPPGDDPPGVTSSETVWLMDPTYAEARNAALKANDGLPTEFDPPPRSSKVEVTLPVFSSPFSEERLIDECQRRSEPPLGAEGPFTATSTDVSGQLAVMCSVRFSALSVQVPVTEWVALPDGMTLRLAIGVLAPNREQVDTIQTILASLEVAGVR